MLHDCMSMKISKTGKFYRKVKRVTKGYEQQGMTGDCPVVIGSDDSTLQMEQRGCSTYGCNKCP